MTDNEIDCLIEQLNNIHLKRESAVRVIGQNYKQKAVIVRRIQSIRANRPQPNPRREMVDTNGNRTEKNLQEGQIVRITNHLREKHGIFGKVVISSRRIVEIRNESTGRHHSRAW